MELYSIIGISMVNLIACICLSIYVHCKNERKKLSERQLRTCAKRLKQTETVEAYHVCIRNMSANIDIYIIFYLLSHLREETKKKRNTHTISS